MRSITNPSYQSRVNADWQTNCYRVLGNACAVCGSTDNLRFIVRDSQDPRFLAFPESVRSGNNRVTLFRAICLIPDFKDIAELRCWICRSKAKMEEKLRATQLG